MARQPAKPWTGECQRCKEKVSVRTMSIFNTELICLKCRDEERRHPASNRALIALNDAARKGLYDFPGIGLPSEPDEPKEGNIWED